VIDKNQNSDYASASSIAESEIPVIDISGLIQGHPGEEDKVAAQIMEASRRIGFFYIKNHGIPQATIDAATEVMKSYFAQPEELKKESLVNTSQRGWLAQGMAKLEGGVTHDLKEIFFWGPEQWSETELANKDKDPLVAGNRWPEKFPQLKEQTLPYYDAICGIGHKLLSALALGLGVPRDTFEQRYESPLARGQLVYYPVSTQSDEAERRLGAAPHTDFGVLTLLLQDNNGGLQVLNRDNEWVAATPIPGTIVCNIGDLMNRWSNERLSSNLHRVINRSGRERHSIAIFFDPSPSSIVDPCDLGVSKEEAKYEPISTSDYIHQKNQKNFSQYGKMPS
jgi:isopenicillin N synthase-like dioxygenase